MVCSRVSLASAWRFGVWLRATIYRSVNVPAARGTDYTSNITFGGLKIGSARHVFMSAGIHTGRLAELDLPCIRFVYLQITFTNNCVRSTCPDHLPPLPKHSFDTLSCQPQFSHPRDWLHSMFIIINLLLCGFTPKMQEIGRHRHQYVIPFNVHLSSWKMRTSA